MEERIAELEARLDALEHARYSIRPGNDPWLVPGTPRYATLDDALVAYYEERAATDQNIKGYVRVFDHATFPPKDITKEATG